jgi:hypothetical protein
MNMDDKAKNDRASARDASGGKDPEMEEIIDLVDEVPPDDDSSRLEQAPEIVSETEVDDEDIIELTDVVEESFSDTKIGDTTLEGGAEEILELVGEQGSEEEEPIELVDEVVPEVDSAQEQEESVEVDDLAEGVGFDEDSLTDTLLEKLSDEKIEEIITRIAKQTIEEKVERILLEAAESAIAREIERLKQAL